MNTKILKKDLRRKKSMNFILLIFVMLATTFIAASVNNMKIITTGLPFTNLLVSNVVKNIVVVITSMIGVWLVVMPANTINTLQSEEIAAWFGLAPCDFFLLEQNRVEENVAMSDRKVYEDYLDELQKRLEDMDVPIDYTFTEVLFKYKISKGDLSYNSMTLL